MGCCKKPEALSEIITKCSEKYPFEHRRPNICYGECVFNETGLAVDGVIQRDKISSVIGEFYKDMPDLIPVATEAIEKCGEIIRAKMEKGKERKPQGDDQCHHVPSMYAGCFFAQTTINCPDSAWQDTDDCNRAREFMKSCPMPHRPKE
ncbi:uncharacterized protein LOC119659326 [Hermetia illucens]|nr:uncharacterized protein LOC119659326 [Hermetia illucens]